MKKLHDKIRHDNENGAKRDMLEELFNDMYKSRPRIYLVNFMRGIFFGFGSVLGGTILVALVIWLLTQFAGWLPDALGNFIESILHSIKT